MDEQQREEQIRQRYDTWKRGVYAGNDPDEYERWYAIRTMLYSEDVPWLLAQLAHERQRANTFESLLRSAEQDHHKSCIGCGVPFHAVLIGTGRHTDDCPVVAALTTAEEAMDDGH